MENSIVWIIILIFLELFEAFMQRSETLYGVLKNLYSWYQKSIFFFFLMHPTFYFILFIVIDTDILNVYMIMILTLKIFDMFYKIELIKTIFIKQKISADLAAILEWKIPSWFFLMGVGLYPPLLFYAFLG